MAPSWRSKWLHMPISRGSRYLYWASSTWRRPSRVRARWAKISRIRADRSSTPTFSSSPSTRCWEGDRALSKMTISAPMVRTSWRTSSTLPWPMKVRGSGLSFCWSTMPTLSPPAVSSRSLSSSMDSSVAFSSRVRLWALRPTSTARFSLSLVKFSVIQPPKFRSPFTWSGPPRSHQYTWCGSPSGDTSAPPRRRG